MSTRAREFAVGVFEHPGPRKVALMAYTLWFNPDWDGCCLHRLIAESGEDAKRMAIAEHRGLCMKGTTRA